MGFGMQGLCVRGALMWDKKIMFFSHLTRVRVLREEWWSEMIFTGDDEGFVFT